MNNLNFLREAPPLNWLDYFVDRKKFSALLDSEGPDSRQISTLANQFTEQALSVDKECELLFRKEFDEEDLAYSRRKAAKLWICALSCFASINWNLHLMKQCCSIVSMKALMNRLVAFCYPSRNINLNDDIVPILSEFQAGSHAEYEKSEQMFACWLYTMWLLKVDTDGRFPEIVAKPTVSNPSSQYDANLMQAEQFRNYITELRKKTGEAEGLLKKILESSNRKTRMLMPTKDCFLEALAKEPNLTADNVLRMGRMESAPALVPDFQAVKTRLDYNCWTLKALYSLMCNHFAAGKIQEARAELDKIVKNWSKYKKGLEGSAVPFTRINEDALAGYCDAFGIAHSFRISTPHTQNEELMYGPISEKTLEVLDCCSMVRRSECQRIACTSAAALADDILAENTISEYCNGFPATLKTLTKLAANSSAVARLIRICMHLVKRRTNEQLVKELIQFFSTKIPNFVEGFRKAFPDCSREYFGNFRDIPRRPVCAVPSVSYIKELLSGGTDGWRLIVSFDMNEIKSLYAKMGGKITVPRRSRISKMVGDVLSAAATSQGNFEHINLMLGKLEQLAVIGDGTQWRTFCNDCVKEMGPLGKVQEIQVRFAFDAVRVQLECWHTRFSRVSNNPQFVHVTQALNSTVKGLIQSSMTSPVTMGKMMLHTVTFFINTSEWEFLLRSFSKLKSPFLDVAKMIAAYMTSTDPAVARQIAEGPWWHVMIATFQDQSSGNKRRNDGSLVREQTKQLLSRMQFLEMLRLIKEHRTISFLISFIGKMFNDAQKVVKLKKESDTSVVVPGQEINKDIFVEHIDYWQSNFEKRDPDDEFCFNLPFLSECLETVLKNALVVNPINAFWLRSFADFCHACDRYYDALVLYMEACVACSDSLLRPLPDNVVDDVMWLKVQRCLRRSGAGTLSTLICQLMRNPTECYVPTAASFMETRGDTLDACTAYFPLISDINLAEFMSDVLEKLHLQKKEQLLLRAVSVPEINSHNVSQLERFRRRERLLVILCAHIFRIHF